MSSKTSNDDTARRREQATKLMRDWLAGFINKDVEGVIGLFADDAVIEFPFAPDGFPSRLEGKEAVTNYIKDHPFFEFRAFPDLQIQPMLDPDSVLAEYRSDADITLTGQPYDQTYISFLKMKDGKIVFYREYWNPTVMIEAFGGQEALNKAFSGGRPPTAGTGLSI